MELKATEQEVSLLRSIYSTIYFDCLKELPHVKLPRPTEMEASIDDDSSHAKTIPSRTAQSIKDHWDDWLRRMELLAPVIEKFRQRLHYIDPITEKPRYGTQTAARVATLVDHYTSLVTTTLLPETQTIELITSQLQSAVEIEQEKTATAAHAQQQQELVEAQAQAAAEAVAQQTQEAAKRAAEEEQQRAARVLAQQLAEERRVAAEAAAADRAWVDRLLPRSLERVREQLERFRATEGSMTSLEMIYAQILAHPEEEKFRRIRRNHPQFMQDIGRYDGGKEILVASGFDIGVVDEIPSLVCREPNVETDLDGWTTWFDLLKGTLDLIRGKANQ